MFPYRLTVTTRLNNPVRIFSSVFGYLVTYCKIISNLSKFRKQVRHKEAAVWYFRVKLFLSLFKAATTSSMIDNNYPLATRSLYTVHSTAERGSLSTCLCIQSVLCCCILAQRAQHLVF